jgi:hypothetical protein
MWNLSIIQMEGCVYFRAVVRLLVVAILLVGGCTAFAQQKIVWSDQEKPIAEQIGTLRKLDDAVRSRTTKDLALQIRQLPAVPNKVRLAGALSNLSTEGDFGRDTLQEVTTTLAAALREQPPAGKPGGPNRLYMELASLVRYEHMQAESDNPQFAEALAKLAASDAKRQDADFTPYRSARQTLASAGTAWQGRAGELLGDVVSALPQGNARPAGFVR